ncbi:MAG: hypothetical protein AB7I48_23800 [Planctomycetaceae bacterium]
MNCPPEQLAPGHVVTFPMPYLPMLWSCTCGATGGGGIEGARRHVLPNCPDCDSDSLTDAPTQSRMALMCELCGRTFDQPSPATQEQR